MSDRALGILAAELRWRSAPDLASAAFTAEALLPRVRELAGTRVELAERDEGGGMERFVFPEVRSVHAAGELPMVVAWALPDAGAVDELPPEAFLHSSAWPEAREALAGATHAMLVTDVMARLVPPAQRLRAYHAVLRAVVESTRPAGVVLVGSDRVLPPAAYLDGLDRDPTGFSVALNVRRFHTDPATGESVFDTMGLAPLGLPDVQLQFIGLDQEAAAHWVASVAWSLFERGDVIADGHVVSGLDPAEVWPCRHEIGLADPERVVIDVDPSPHGPARPG